jgi:hypothetical protein
MKHLPDPIRDGFDNQGHWVLSKTNNAFSAIPIDQAHEQENANVKGSAGGCIGLTENPIAFRCWMLSGPELARLQKQFEDQYLPTDDEEDPRYFQNHQSGYAAQRSFHEQVLSLYSTVKKMGNPFLDNFPELVTLDNCNCMDESVVKALYTLEDTGMKQYQTFAKSVLEDCTHSIRDPIKQNSLALFKRPQPRAQSKQGKKIKILQNNVALFGKLYIAMHNRDGNLKDFFSHEIQAFPPSLSEFGKLHLPNVKSELLKCLQLPTQPEPPLSCDCKVLDGAVIVHCLPTTGVVTFDEYAEKVFVPYLRMQLHSAKRLDIVWDTYLPDSLKQCTRNKRGKGVRRKVSGQTKLPSKWMDFLCDSKNKEELFAFLTSKVVDVAFPPGNFVIRGICITHWLHQHAKLQSRRG